MTREEAIEQLKWYFEYDNGLSADKETVEAYRMAIKALEQEPCEDCISRRDMALNIVSFYNKATGKKKTLDFLCKCVEGLPSVQPKTGWIPVSERLPERDGEYLITTTTATDRPVIRMRSFAKNLKKVDPYDFADAKGCGWYDYDSEFGYWQDTDVKAWMSLPEPYNTESEHVVPDSELLVEERYGEGKSYREER